MTQNVFDPNLTPSLALLDANFTELYGWQGDSTSWTPAFSVETGLTGSWTYSVQTGRYSKTRRRVVAEFELSWTAKPSAGSIVLIALPVTALVTASVKGSIAAFSGVTLLDRMAATGSMLGLSNYTTTLSALTVSGSGLSSSDPRINVSSMSTAGSMQGLLIYTSAT